MSPISLPINSLRFAKWFCGVLVFFSLLVLGGYWFNRLAALSELEEATLRDMEHRASALTAAVSEQTRGAIYNLDLALLHLAHLHAHNGRLTAHDVEEARNSTPLGLVQRVIVIDRTGRASVTHPAGGSGLLLYDRSYFRAHATGGQRGLFIGAPIESRIEKDWVIPFSRRLVDKDGNFAGVIAVMVQPQYFAELYGRLAQGSGDVIALVLQDGSFLSRSLNLNEHLGKRVRADRPFVGPDAPESGTFRSVSTHEPVARVFAFRRLNEWPLVTIIGLGVAEALAPVRAGSARDMRSAVAVSVLVVLLVAGICIVVMRLEKSLLRVRESDERRAMAFAGADELAWEWDLGARQLRFFGKCEVFFGGAGSERVLSVNDWLPLIHPDEREAVREQSRIFLSFADQAMELRFRLRFADGRYRWVLVRGQKLSVDASGRVSRALGILMDVDVERRAQIEAAQTREAYRRLIESAGEGIFVVDEAGLIGLFNPAAEQLLGWQASEVLGRNSHELLHVMDKESPFEGDRHCPVCDTLRDRQSRRAVRLTYRHKSGRLVPVNVSVSPLVIDDQVGGAVVVVTDISQRLVYEAELERLARTDGLTGLWNRRYFAELVEREWHRAERDGSPLTLLMVDLDHFKAVNDQYGHAAGDAVLVALAELFRTQLRLIDIVGRLGGEEFSVALPGIDIAEARGVAERLRSELEACEIAVGEQRIRCTISIGVAMWDRRESFDTLLARADAALYAAKRNGRNRVEVDQAFRGVATG